MRTVSTERDELFGEVVIRIDSGSGVVEVGGTDVPVALLRRRTGSEASPGSRIGSRDQHKLTLRIGDSNARITPASAGLSRRSYRVDIQVDDLTYRLIPDAAGSSAFSRNGCRLGRLWADDDGGVRAEWTHCRRLASNSAGVLTEQLEDRNLEPLDAAVGYLLAAAYGTGAPARWELILRGLLSLLGG